MANTLSLYVPDAWGANDIGPYWTASYSVDMTLGSSYESPQAGMGWRFLAQATKKSKKLLNLEIFISPASCCLFPNTTVAVELQHPVINKPRSSVKIPTAPSDWHRVVLKKVTIHSLKFINILFSVTIQFRLPATAAISSPLQIAHSPRDKKLALSTLDGRNPIDIRFVLEGSKEVFGVSNLLRGRSDVLDKLVDNEPQEDLSVGWDYDDDSDTEEDHLLSPASSDSSSGISSLSSGYYPISAPNTLPSVPPPRPSDELPSPSSSRCIKPLTLETIRAHDASGDNIRTIIVKVVAYKTFKTVLSYIYTDDDTFLSPNNTSPKSLYRLADKLHLIPLKARSLAAIQDGLTTSNIIDETTSVFSSNYPEILDVQVAFLKQHLSDADVSQLLNEKIVAMAEGRLRRGAAAMRKIIF